MSHLKMREVKPKTPEYMESSMPGMMKKKKAEPNYPKIRLDLETIPEAKNWKVGETYSLDLEVKMVGLSISRFDNSAEFEIHKIGTEDEAEELDEGEEK